MSTTAAIRAASNAGGLLETIAATPHDKFESVSELLSALHNEGEIDLLAACDKSNLDALSRRSFFCLQRVFGRTLPKLCCSTKDAAEACERMFERAGEDGAAGFVFPALVQWFQQSPARVGEGLELIDQHPGISADVVRSLLLGRPGHVAVESTNDALSLSNRTNPDIRLPALWALARVLPDEDEHLLARVLERLTDVVTDPLSERDTTAAVDSALHLYGRMGGRVRNSVESIVTSACGAPSPPLRHALAFGLAADATGYSDAVIDTCFSVLHRTPAKEAATLSMLDSVLSGWDLDRDRERIARFLVDLLSQEVGTFNSLSGLQHKLRNGPGDVLGWYVVSLLLTGRHSVCRAVLGLLPYDDKRTGLDVDLRPFALSSRRILFLARKVLGYCLFRKAAAAAFLLSCLRVVSEDDRQELEQLVLDHLLMNYPSVVDWLKTATPTADTAKKSVDRLSVQMCAYMADLERFGPCRAFAPTERERQIQHYKMADLFRYAQKEAQESSALLQIIPKANLLYGTGSIVYVHRGPDANPVRQELPMSTIRHEVEIPRLQVLDPVGLQRDLLRFRSEPSPE